jgi:hypothetical protein
MTVRDKCNAFAWKPKYCFYCNRRFWLERYYEFGGWILPKLCECKRCVKEEKDGGKDDADK